MENSGDNRDKIENIKHFLNLRVTLTLYKSQNKIAFYKVVNFYKENKDIIDIDDYLKVLCCRI